LSIGENVGEIRDYSTRQVIGAHKGLWFHTIGQRKGLGLLLNKGHVHCGPYYVADKHIESNALLVTNNYAMIDAPRRRFVAEKLNWMIFIPEALQRGEVMQVKVKLRHGPSLSDASIRLLGTGEVGVELVEKDKGIAPGQFAVFYDIDFTHVLLAGAVAYGKTFDRIDVS
jgi:tRNA U34 2-thiouridine synthase MnmA/TrmU